MNDGSAYQPGQRRWLYATATIVALLVMVQVVRLVFIRQVERNWESLKSEVDSTQAAAIASRLDETAQELTVIANSCQDVTASRGVTHQVAIRRVAALLDDAEQRGIAFELRDSFGRLKHYGGFALAATNEDTADGMALVDGTPYTMLVYESRLSTRDGKLWGIIRLGTPFRVTVPVNRRFLNTEGLIESLAQEYELDLRLEPLPLTRRPSERVYVAFSPGKRTLAVFSFEGAGLDAYLDGLEFQFHRIAVFLLLALAIIVSIPLFRAELRLPWSLLSILAATLHCWALRFVFLATATPMYLLPDSAMDPVAFASTFGYGIAAAPGEMLFTVLTLLVNTAFIYLRVLRDRDRRIGIIPALSVMLMVAALFPLALRALAASLRSFVIDSSFNYDDVGALFDDGPHVLMIANTWVLTLAYTFVLLAMYLAVKRALRPIPDRPHSLLLHSVTAALGIALFLAMTGDSLFPGWVFVLAGILFVLPAHLQLPLLRHSSSSPGTPFLAAAVIGSLLSVAMYSDAMEEKRSAEIQAIAIDLSRPVDAWSHVLMEQTLQEISRATLVDSPVPGSRPAYETAFRIWSASPLSRLQNNSAILLIDSTGVPVSRFAVGNDPFLLSMQTLSTTIEKTEGIVQSVYRRLDDREKRYYKGYTDITGTEGRLFAVVVLESLDPMQISHNAVDLLRSTATTRSLAPEDRFVVSRFSGNRLRQTSEPLIERGLPLPTVVREAFAGDIANMWATLRIGDDDLHSYFTKLSDDGEVLAITRGKSELLLSIYRWLRIAFLFTIMSLAGLAVTILFLGRFTGWKRMTFSRKLQISLLAVAAIPLLLIWIAGRDFVMDTTQRDIEQQVTDNLEVLRSNILAHLPDIAERGSIPGLLTDQLCQETRLRTGKDVNVYSGVTLVGTSKPELYHTGLLNNKLNPDAWMSIAVRGRDIHVATEQIGEFPYYVGYRALRDAEGHLAAIISTPTLFERNRAEEVYIRASAAVFLWITLMGFIVLLVSTALSRQISRPLGEFLHATRDITAGNLDRKVRVHGSAEFVDLMTAFNTMTDRLRQSQAELTAAERELAWKEMARQVAHEIRNPLTPMKLSAQHLQRAWRDRAAHLGDIIEKVTRTLIDQIDSLSRISDEFSRFGRMPRRTMSDVDISRLVEEAVALFRTHEDVRFVLRIASALPVVLADREELSRALTNLLRNSIQAISEHGLITVTASTDGNAVQIMVEDNGVGIPPELLPRIFEPNFSTKTEGMGLGLAIVKKIIDDAGGTIRIESTVGIGTRVFIELPPAPEEREMESESGEPGSEG